MDQISKTEAATLFVVGWGMGLVPIVAPEWFPTRGSVGNPRALWLHAMGVIQAAMGAWYLIKTCILPGLAESLRFRHPPARGAAPGTPAWLRGRTPPIRRAGKPGRALVPAMRRL